MNNNVLVSCIIPVYNTAEYLYEFFDSLLKQSFQNFEIICVDDDSTDTSVSIILEYQKKKDIILLRNHTRLGAAQSRNRGLNVARGEYVIFLDSDDILHLEMLGRMYRCCKQNDADIAMCYLEYFKNEERIPIENTEKNGWIIPDYPVIEEPGNFEHIFQVVLNAPYDKMIRRELLIHNNIKFQDLPRSNDIFYSYSAVLSSKKIVFVDQVLYFIRYMRKGSITATWIEKDGFLCEALDAVFDFMINKKNLTLAYKSLVERAIKDIYKEFERGSRDYQQKLRSKLKDTYLEKWQIMALYRKNELTSVQMRIIDIILKDEEVVPYYTILFTSSYKKIISLINDLHADNKEIIWWGAGKVGLAFLTQLQKLELNVDYVVDRDMTKQGEIIAGYTITGWDTVKNKNCVILMANSLWKNEIKEVTEGLAEIINVIYYLE